YGTPITPPEVPVKEGYVFSGWRNLPKTMPDEEVRAEGRYYLRRYRVICEADGEEVDRVQVLYGAEPVLPDAPEKEGFRFDGWDGVPKTMPAQDVTVTAKYVEA
ncbi:MAG: InlB B-repeat-containing protein, partial [Clostridia bacterium]|nr:InlB B-repeat-containing protein [Clostridia bacterium]